MLLWPDEKYKNSSSLEELASGDTPDPKALNNIGYGYYTPDFGYSKDKSKAFEYFKRASYYNDRAALVNLAYCYSNGISVTRDKDKGIELLEKASSLGEFYAMEKLANIFKDDGDTQKAIEYYKKASECKTYEDEDNFLNSLIGGFELSKDVHLDDAKYFAEKIFLLCEEHNNNELEKKEAERYLGYEYLGKYYYDKGEYEISARDYNYRPARGMLIKKEADELFSGMHDGKCSIKYWDYEEAVKKYKEASDYLYNNQEINAKFQEIQQFSNIGEYEPRGSLKKKLEAILPDIFEYYAKLLSENYNSDSIRIDYVDSNMYGMTLNMLATRSARRTTIEISDEEPVHSHGRKLSKAEMLKILKSNLRRLEGSLRNCNQNGETDRTFRHTCRLEEIIRELKRLIDALENDECSDDEIISLADQLRGIWREYEMPVSVDLKRVLDIVCYRESSYWVTSLYDYRRRTIILYINNIKKFLDSNWNLEKHLVRSLSHAAFYAFHHATLMLQGKRWPSNQKYDNEIIKSSLAEFGEYSYSRDIILECNNGDCVLQDSFVRTWRMKPIELWPYSGALYYLEALYYGSSNKNYLFQDVFYSSLADFNTAIAKLHSIISVHDDIGGTIYC